VLLAERRQLNRQVVRQRASVVFSHCGSTMAAAIAMATVACAAGRPGTETGIRPFREDSVKIRYATRGTSLRREMGAIEVELICNGIHNTAAGKVTLLARDSLGQDISVDDLPIGQYRFAEVLPGEYRVWSQHIGCWGSRVGVRVRSGVTTSVRVWLSRQTVQTVPINM
jgi:hypothetical protein